MYATKETNFLSAHSVIYTVLPHLFVQFIYDFVVCRALGIPCRSVTVYRAPVEKTSLDFDMHWRYENERENDLLETYHCWNDVWIRRDDILQAAGSTYAGWQALDPHERGNIRYCFFVFMEAFMIYSLKRMLA